MVSGMNAVPEAGAIRAAPFRDALENLNALDISGAANGQAWKGAPTSGTASLRCGQSMAGLTERNLGIRRSMNRMTHEMAAKTGDSIPTRASRLNRIETGDNPEIWRESCDTCGGLIRAFSIKAGLTEDKAEEVVQEAAISVARNLPGFRYDPGVCSFKTWLLNLTTWRIKDHLRRRVKRRQAVRPPAAVALPDAHSARAGPDLFEWARCGLGFAPALAEVIGVDGQG
jgi:hypothetical protein